MFKLIGSLMVVASSAFLFSAKIISDCFTYRFLEKTTEIIKAIQCEKHSNLTYHAMFEKLGFNVTDFLQKARHNCYIEPKELQNVQELFDNLGTRDSVSEQQYLSYNLEKLTEGYIFYRKRYSENRKSYLLCGVSAGLMIIILLI